MVKDWVLFLLGFVFEAWPGNYQMKKVGQKKKKKKKQKKKLHLAAG